MTTPDSLRIAARALGYWERRQQVMANNLANTETPGFKGERVFAQLLADRSVVAGEQTDLSAGPVHKTGRPLDVMVGGGDFLVVRTTAGERLRQGGSLSLDSTGTLVDEQGRPVLGKDGPIVLPPGTVNIDGDGVITVDGHEMGELRVERPSSPANLTHEAGAVFADSGTSTTVPPGQRQIRQGALEDSNVNSLDALVDMLNIQRNYASVLKGVNVMDDVLDTVANRLGRVS